MSRFYRMLRLFLRFVLQFYYAQVEMRGLDALRERGPLLILANHHISLVDPCLLIALARRPLSFLAKEPLFRIPLLGAILRKLHSIPVYRQQDKGYAKEKNEGLFDQAKEALSQGRALVIFPEGVSHDDPALAPLRHGAAKIALETAASFHTEVQVLCVGIHYEQTRLFRGRILICLSTPLKITPYLAAFEQDARATTAAVTEQFRRQLSELILDAETHEDVELAGVVDQLGVIPFAEPGIAGDFDRKKIVLAYYQNLKTKKPLEVNRLKRRLRFYQRILRTAALPKKGHLPSLVSNVTLIVLGFPVFYLGVFANAIPFLLVRFLTILGTKAERRGDDARAAIGIVTAMLIFPLWYALLSLYFFTYFYWGVALVLLSAAPSCGIFALRWLEAWQRILADTLTFVLSPWTLSTQKRLHRFEERLRVAILRLAD